MYFSMLNKVEILHFNFVLNSLILIISTAVEIENNLGNSDHNLGLSNACTYTWYFLEGSVHGPQVNN